MAFGRFFSGLALLTYSPHTLQPPQSMVEIGSMGEYEGSTTQKRWLMYSPYSPILSHTPPYYLSLVIGYWWGSMGLAVVR